MKRKSVFYLKLVIFILFGITTVAANSNRSDTNSTELTEDDYKYEDEFSYEDENTYGNENEYEDDNKYEGSAEHSDYTMFDDEDYFNNYNSNGGFNENNSEDYLNDEDLYKEWAGFDGFKCGDGMRLPKDKICDGVVDCDDCSDEENCTHSAENLFFCYEKGVKPASNQGPICIAMKYFCDGAVDCPNGSDEVQSGPGFKCQVKDRFRKCVLPEEMVCDDVTNCEDGSDVCKDVETTTISDKNSSMEERRSDSPADFFRCLSSGLLISQNQLCDGEFDCLDLSDECLCEVKKSSIVHDVCNAMCTRTLWKNQDENPNCLKCNPGEIYWRISQDIYPEIEEKDCFSTDEILDLIKNDTEKIGSLIDKKPDHDVIECFDLSLNGMIRARKCDGRPECFFGEDECNVNCSNNKNQEWYGSGQPDFEQSFCQLLASDYSGYFCLSDLKAEKIRNKTAESRIEKILISERIMVCDGITECDDGSDEAFCPTRLRCSPELNETYDVAQQCDGFSHCQNGEDEQPEICVNSSSSNILPCGQKDGVTKYFHSKYLMDGKSDCPTSADECPPFLTKIDKIKEKFYEGVNKEQLEKTQYSISTHDRAIDDLPLQVFLIAAAFIGMSALVVSLALGFYNLRVAQIKFSNKEAKNSDVWIHNGIICIREITNLSITIAKGFVCGYFAYIKITRTEDYNYSLVDLEWRSSTPCSVAGSLVLIGTQVPIFSLASFAAGYLLYRAFRARKQRSYNVSLKENGRLENNGVITSDDVLNSRKKTSANILLIFSCFLLIVIGWLPVVLLSVLLTYHSALNSLTRTYAWVQATSAPSLFRANLLGREFAENFASTLVTITNKSHAIASTYFTFTDFTQVVNSTSSSIGIHMRGSYGYFSQSGSCLPSFLTHVSGGVAPFDMAVSNSWTWGISLAILITDLVLIIATTVMTTRYADAAFRCSCCTPRYAQPEKKCNKVLNSTFSFLVVIEVLTGLFIISLFFLKAAVPDSLSDSSYVICCITVLGLNCGIFSPFVLLRRKFQLRNGQISATFKRRPRSFNESTRIIEDNKNNKEEETKPLNYEKNPSEEHAKNDESENLMARNNAEISD